MKEKKHLPKLTESLRMEHEQCPCPEGALIIFDQLILGIHAHRREKRLNNRALVA